MGGGAAMRAAAKVAGASILNNGFRGVGLPDNTLSTAARKAARPIGGVLSSSSSDSGKRAAAVGVDQEAVQTQTPCFDFSEWELAGGEEDLLAVSGDGAAMPRLVFGGAPSIEEAKEATSELKDVLEKAYLSSSPSSPISRRRSHSGDLEVTPCLTSEAIVTHAPPLHAIQAFKYLSESPEAQTVVASIASDPNVWKAVLHNPVLQEYIQAQNINAVNVDLYEKASSTASSESHKNGEGSFGMDDVVDYLQSLKHSVVGMVNHVGDYFQNLFGVSNGAKDAKENPMSGFLDKALGPSLFGLAVMVIMMVVLKRA